MAENVDNLILEPLRLIREDVARMEARMEERFGDVETGQQAFQGVVMGLGHYINALDMRVEHIEETLEARI